MFTSMRLAPGAAAAAVVALAGCGKPPPEPAAAQFDAGYPMPEFMAHAMQPAAEKFWAAAGTISDEKGTRYLRPTTPEAWKSVEDGAITTVELSNALLLPARLREPQADWRKHVAGVAAVARKAQQAAEAQAEEDTLLELGGQLYEACQACHEQFNPNYLAPETNTSATNPAK